MPNDKTSDEKILPYSDSEYVLMRWKGWKSNDGVVVIELGWRTRTAQQVRLQLTQQQCREISEYLRKRSSGST